MAKNNFRTVKVQRGDTVSAMVQKLFPKLSREQRVHAWKSLYYRKVVNGKAGMVPLEHPNKIYVGDIIYYRVSAAGDPFLKSERPKAVVDMSANHHGVINPYPEKLSDAEAVSLRRDMAGAIAMLTNAISALEKMSPGTTQQFDLVFFGGDMNSQRRRPVREEVLKNYKAMKDAGGAAPLFKQDTTPRMKGGGAALAYASFKGAIVVWDAAFFGSNRKDEKEFVLGPRQRASALVHELAHYAVNARHTIEGNSISGNPQNGADTLEQFVDTINRTGKSR